MKKNSLLLLTLILAACQQELAPDRHETEAQIFSAETEAFCEKTRTSLNQSNTVIWSANDRLAIFNGSTLADTYQVVSGSVGKDRASFQKVLQEYGNDDFFSGTELATNIAIYPYEDDLVCTYSDEGNGKTSYAIRNVTIPSVQAYQKDAFPDEAFVMAAITENVRDTYLHFSNVCGVFNLKLTGTGTVSSIELSGNAGEILSGNATLSISNDGSIPYITLDEDASRTVTLDCAGGVALNEKNPTSFMIATAPVRFEKGFNIRLTKSNGDIVVISTEKANEIKRSRILEMPSLKFQDYTDISTKGTANSYIITQSGCYRIKAVKGNSNESVGAAHSAEVLWESFGTDTAPKIGDLITEAGIEDGYVTFKTNRNYKKGNAVIAAKDANGKILWSWHIWFTDMPESQTYNNNAGIMMDRNLGAISAVPGDVLSVGLLYQWGRKDPFLNICEFGTYDTDPSDNKTTLGVKESKSTITWPETVTGDKKNGTIAYAIEHPTTFIKYYNNLDWLYASSSSLVDKTRWQSSKTIYDPCPAGWRVPDGGENGIWEKHGLDPEGEVWNCPYPGVILKTDYNEDIWYPMSTYRIASSGALENDGISALYWSVTYAPNSNYIIALGIASYSPIYGLGRGSTPATLPNWKTSAAYGYSVRCCKITE